MKIRGVPIPYTTPNAAAHVERLIGTIRRECLDRIMIWNQKHLRATLKEFISWYNNSRVHQGLHGIPDPDPQLMKPKPKKGRLVAIPVLGGLHHDYRLVA
jgi:transposase InsO family protein